MTFRPPVFQTLLYIFLCLLNSALFLAASTSNADVFKWVDENGKVHFGDKKPENQKAKELTFKINTYTNVSFDKSIFQVKDNRVIMYSTTWCGYCKKARRYFEQHQIPFVEYDIEKNSAAKKRYHEMGAKGVPVILVGNKRMNGFSKAGFKRIYEKN